MPDKMEFEFNLPADRPSCYVAGPEGFTEVGREWLNGYLIPLLEELGLAVISPWDPPNPEDLAAALEMPVSAARNAALQAAYRGPTTRNFAALQIVDCVVASLEGPDVDDGTASEIGAYATLHDGAHPQRPIIAYRTDWRDTGESGAICNPQLVFFIELSGGQVVTSLADLKRALVQWVDAWHAARA